MSNLDSPVYWRLLKTEDSVQAVCMQWFDEYDYDQTQFLNASQYPSEEAALLDWNTNVERLILVIHRARMESYQLLNQDRHIAEVILREIL